MRSPFETFTLSRLSEAVNMPVCPDRGILDYNPNLSASAYLENDLERLYRSRVNMRIIRDGSNVFKIGVPPGKQ